MKHIGLFVLIFAFFVGFDDARADDSAPPPAATPVAMTAAAWDAEYDAARLLLRDGRFAEAANALASVAERAPDVGRKRLALEQSWLALYWVKRGYQLELLSPQDRAVGRARFADRRTGDELGWLYISSVLYGVGTGITLGFVTEPKSAAAAILPTLALTGGSVALVYALDRKPLRYGGAQAITSGLFIGLEEGIAWLWWHEHNAKFEDELSGRSVALLIWGASTAGAVAGGLVGQLRGTTPGRASLIGSGALWSALTVGFAVGDVTDDLGNGLLGAAVALNLGAAAGLILGDQFAPSIGRVRFIDLGALSGALLVGGLYGAFFGDSTDGRGVLTAASAGTVAGAATAWVLTRKMAPDDPLASSSPLVPTVMPVRDSGGLVVGMAGAF